MRVRRLYELFSVAMIFFLVSHVINLTLEHAREERLRERYFILLSDCDKTASVYEHPPTIPACFTPADDKIGFTLLQKQGASDLHCYPELDEQLRPSTWCTPFVPAERFYGLSGL